MTIRMSSKDAKRLGVLGTSAPKRSNRRAASSLSQMDKIAAMSPAQALMTTLMKPLLGDILHVEYPPFPDSRIRLDLAVPHLKLAIEINGWQHHGKTLDAFKSDHERTRRLMLDGWVVFPFVAGSITSDPMGCVDQVMRLIERMEGARP